LPAGTVLKDRYVLEEPCGRSRIGTVFSAVDRENDARVVVKVLAGRFIPGTRSLDYLEQLLVERRSFVHPNLVQVLDSFRVPLEAGKESMAVVLERLGGKPVAEIIDRREEGVRTPAELLLILGEVLKGMRFLHEQRIETVPLHPRRVFLDVSGSQSVVKIPAFGYFTSAEWIRDSSRWGCTTGIDYRYVAPEMLAEGSYLAAGERADIYLFGLLAFELLVGAPPFEANRETLIQLHRTEPVPEHLLPAEAPSWLIDLIRACLAKDPAGRPAFESLARTIETERASGRDPLLHVALPAEKGFVRVLFVGDNRLDQLSVARMAKSERLPFHYRIAHTLEKAEEILEHREVDVIVTDHFLPDGTSFDLLKREENPVPVIVITGSEKTDVKEALLKAGAYACLTKDLRQAHLKSLRELLLKAHKKEVLRSGDRR
jgi:serine/threonine protein kinase